MATIYKDSSTLVAEAVVACLLVVNDINGKDDKCMMHYGPETVGDRSAIRVACHDKSKIVWIYGDASDNGTARVFVGEQSNSDGTVANAPDFAGRHKFESDKYFEAAQFIYTFLNS
jgi:hypothetical protein